MYVTIAKVALALLNFYEIVWQAIQLGLFKGTSILRARAASFRVGGGGGGLERQTSKDESTDLNFSQMLRNAFQINQRNP